ncbi:MAG: hypothetical protein ACETWK_04885 [Candidatus Aminicenantaceae bacterium]
MDEQDLVFPERAYELLSLAAQGRDLTVRDDQHDFSWLLYIFKASRKRRQRFRLIDSGKFDAFKLEQLGNEGVDLYTSNEARPKPEELELINRSCKRGRAIVAYSHQGSINREEKKGSNTEKFTLTALRDMGKNGIYFYLSNRKWKHDFSLLSELAYFCQKGGSWLVYYHYGPLETSLEDLARNGAWIHISDQSVREPKGTELLMKILESRSSKRTNLILHLEEEWKASQLRDIINAEAIVLFQSSLTDYKSPLRPLERESRKRKVDFRSYYLYPYLMI